MKTPRSSTHSLRRTRLLESRHGTERSAGLLARHHPESFMNYPG